MSERRYRLLAFVCEKGVTIPRNGEGWRTLMQVRAECPSACRFAIHTYQEKFILLDMWLVYCYEPTGACEWRIWPNAEQVFDAFEAAVMAGHIRYTERHDDV